MFEGNLGRIARRNYPYHRRAAAQMLSADDTRSQRVIKTVITAAGFTMQYSNREVFHVQEKSKKCD